VDAHATPPGLLLAALPFVALEVTLVLLNALFLG